MALENFSSLIHHHNGKLYDVNMWLWTQRRTLHLCAAGCRFSSVFIIYAHIHDCLTSKRNRSTSISQLNDRFRSSPVLAWVYVFVCFFAVTRGQESVTLTLGIPPGQSMPQIYPFTLQKLRLNVKWLSLLLVSHNPCQRHWTTKKIFG